MFRSFRSFRLLPRGANGNAREIRIGAIALRLSSSSLFSSRMIIFATLLPLGTASSMENIIVNYEADFISMYLFACKFRIIQSMRMSVFHLQCRKSSYVRIQIIIKIK